MIDTQPRRARTLERGRPVSDWIEVDAQQGDLFCPDCGSPMHPSPDRTRCKCHGCDMEYEYRRQTRYLVREPPQVDGEIDDEAGVD